MSDTHVLTIDGNEVQLLLHFAIPNTSNLSSVPYRTILARVYGTTILPDGDGTQGTISAAEKAQIAAGSVVEQIALMKLGNSNPTGQQLDDFHAAQRSAFLVEAQAKYARYGMTR